MLSKACDCTAQITQQITQQKPRTLLLSLARLAVYMHVLPWACSAHLAVMEVQDKVLKAPAVTTAATWHAALQSMLDDTPAICACGACCLQHVTVAAVHIELEPLLLQHTALLLVGDFRRLLHPVLLCLCLMIAVASRMTLLQLQLLLLLQLCATVTEL